MLEESLPSIWASMHSWFTPTVLFILINVVIGTIAFSSTIHKQQEENKDPNTNPKPLSRTSSVLDRLRSINLYRQNTQEIPPLTTTLDLQPMEIIETLKFQEQPNHSTATQIVETVETLKFQEQPSHSTTTQIVETVETLEFEEESHFSRSQSDAHPTAGERPQKLSQKMKKSASAKSAFGHFEEEEIAEVVQRPSTMRERKVFGEDEEVDAKADDFINKFKQQLQLQRLDSIMRYKETLNRGK